MGEHCSRAVSGLSWSLEGDAQMSAINFIIFVSICIILADIAILLAGFILIVVLKFMGRI